MTQEKNLDWKIYESITKYIYETLGKEFGIKIKGYGSTCKVIGKSGVTHQIDVLTFHSDGVHSYETAIECKYWNQKVNKDIVMKLAEIIQDCGINKGIIVCKNGFTNDGIEYAKHKNIELVELREIEEKDLNENPRQIHFADLELCVKTTIRRTEILNIDIGENRKIEGKSEFEYYNFLVIREDESYLSLATYIAEFRKEVNPQNEKTEKLTKHYKIPNGFLYNRETKESLKIDGITFTGQLRIRDESRNLNFKLVDEVWLIMKSIFNERTFTFSENGLIKENKK
jgi:Restriction endonuclease